MVLNVLISGANSGFGLLTAEVFAKAGHHVHAGYRNPEKLAGLEALKADGLPIEPVLLDVMAQDTIDAAVAQAASDVPIDVLVNNAGFELIGPVDEFSEEGFRRQFDTNVLGPLRMIRAVSPAMRARHSGAIVNMSSMAGLFSVPYSGLYAASKHAIEALSEALWFELKPFGVRVALVEPGGYATNFDGNLIMDSGYEAGSDHEPLLKRFTEASRQFIEQNHARQDPREVAETVFAAATDPAPRLRWLVGQDAQSLVPFYRAQEFEAFLEAMLQRLGLPDWGDPAQSLNA